MAAFVFTRMLFDEIYHIIELPFNCLIDDAMFVCLFVYMLSNQITDLFDHQYPWKEYSDIFDFLYGNIM